MNTKEFMKRLDSLYDKSDLLEEKLHVRASSIRKDVLECTSLVLKHEIAKLIGEYFREEEK